MTKPNPPPPPSGPAFPALLLSLLNFVDGLILWQVNEGVRMQENSDRLENLQKIVQMPGLKEVGVLCDFMLFSDLKDIVYFYHTLADSGDISLCIILIVGFFFMCVLQSQT